MLGFKFKNCNNNAGLEPALELLDGCLRSPE